MPRYFEIIADTPKLAREKLRSYPGNVSILKEEKVSQPNWLWGGLRRKVFYRIVVSEYQTHAWEDVLAKTMYADEAYQMSQATAAAQVFTKNATRKELKFKEKLRKSSAGATHLADEAKGHASLKDLLRHTERDFRNQEESDFLEKRKFEEEYTLFDYPKAGKVGKVGKDGAAAQVLAVPVMAENNTAEEHGEAVVAATATKSELVNEAMALLKEYKANAKTTADAKATETKAMEAQIAPFVIEAFSSVAKDLSLQSNDTLALQETKQPHKGICAQDFLARKGFSSAIIEEAMEVSLVKRIRNSDDKRFLAEAIAAMVCYGDGLSSLLMARRKETGHEPHFVFMAGSTGVGKTTTLSKLAFSWTRRNGVSSEKAGCQTEQKKEMLHAKRGDDVLPPIADRIAIGSCDLRRMGALEQIRSFSDIVGIPLEKLHTKMRLIEFYQKYQQADILFVDTPGCGLAEKSLIDEIGELIHCLNVPKTVYWCVSASSRVEDLFVAQERLSPLGATRLIITKVDESSSLGSVLSLAISAKLPLDYLCTGQDILGDIQEARLPDLETILLKEWATSSSFNADE